MKIDKIAKQLRRDALRMTNAVKSGHPGGSLGCADFFAAMYFEILNKKDSFTMDGIGEDIFFLSNGHISPVWYAALARSGFFPVAELASFRKLNSRLQGHPATAEHIEGVRVASGSLGQGLSVAVGAAMAKKLNSDEHLVYCLMGDGELQEGQNWEAFLFAAHNKVDNLIAVIDFNNAQIDGKVDDVLSLANLKAKLEAFNWDVREMNGNDATDLIKQLTQAKERTLNGKPIVIIMKTEMGFGVDFMQGDYKWHGSPLNDEQLQNALSQLEETLGDY